MMGATLSNILFTSQSLYFLRKHKWVGVGEGRSKREGYMYTYIADSFHCTAETNNYMPIEKKKKRKHKLDDFVYINLLTFFISSTVNSLP